MVSLGGQLFSQEELMLAVFAPKSTDLAKIERTKLDAVAQTLEENPELEIEIRGAADPTLDGDEDLHALARRRARAVRKHLEGEGVDEGRIRTGDVDIGPRDDGPDGKIVTHLRLR
jgi:outer membrane protein OmpA-like peptidoglycan-associated protein